MGLNGFGSPEYIQAVSHESDHTGRDCCQSIRLLLVQVHAMDSTSISWRINIWRGSLTQLHQRPLQHKPVCRLCGGAGWTLVGRRTAQSLQVTSLRCGSTHISGIIRQGFALLGLLEVYLPSAGFGSLAQLESEEWDGQLHKQNRKQEDGF